MASTELLRAMRHPAPHNLLAMATPLLALHRTLGTRSTRMIVAHGKSRLAQVTSAVASGVEALDLARFVSELIRDH